MGQQEQQPAIESKRFGEYLRRIRNERRLSLDAVEEMTQDLRERVTKSHLSRIENGQAIPTFPRMFALSQAYGVPVSYLAERFELCLIQDMLPPATPLRPAQQALEKARSLRRSGRHTEALVLYEALMERPDDVCVIDLKLECINCLIKLNREPTAKERCEKLLCTPQLTRRQRVITLQYFAMCCYKLGRFEVALMAMDRVDGELAELENPDHLGAHLGVLKGNLLYATGQFAESAECYRRALAGFQAVRDPFEACRTQLNLAAALIEQGAGTPARTHLDEVLQRAKASGYDRQQAFALSHLALLAFRQGDLERAAAHCIASNRLARSREYNSILFRNCYYLWRIARQRGDDAGVKLNERTLRTYLNRVEPYMPEVAEFKAYLDGGQAHA